MDDPKRKIVFMKHLFYICFLFIVLIGCNNKNKTEMQRESSRKESLDFFSLLQTRIQDGIMLGHQDALAYGSMWYGENDRSDIKSICGDNPAVVGWDISNIELDLAFNTDSIEFCKLKDFIYKVDKLGGINIISWNCKSLSSDITSILQDKTKRQAYLTNLNKVARFIGSLKNESGKSIPIVFRPFHDANISNAWWGIKNNTSENYKKLWRMTIDHFRTQETMDNVLYALSIYNPLSNKDITDYYPGDNYVDIIGCDLYMQLNEDPDGKQYSRDLNKNLSVITTFTEQHNKISALTNTGLQGIKIPNFFSGYIYPIISKYPISYVLFGKNAWNIEELYHIPVPGHPACDDFLLFVNSPHILTCSKLKNT